MCASVEMAVWEQGLNFVCVCADGGFGNRNMVVCVSAEMGDLGSGANEVSVLSGFTQSRGAMR